MMKNNWSKQEVHKYVLFVSSNKELFQEPQIDSKVFQQMGRQINKLTDDCLKFHSKKKKKYRTIDNILTSLCQDFELDIEQIKEQSNKIRNQKFQLLINLGKEISLLRSGRNEIQQLGQSFFQSQKQESLSDYKNQLTYGTIIEQIEIQVIEQNSLIPQKQQEEWKDELLKQLKSCSFDNSNY